jgi:hypothetical protein
MKPKKAMYTNVEYCGAISVPIGKYCMKYGTSLRCEHYRNNYHNCCVLFGNSMNTSSAVGIVKHPDCAELKEIE